MFDFEKGDINMMLSLLNMKLRDEFSSLDSFAERMEENGYFYNSEINQFKKI